MRDSERYRLYREHKSELEPERYLADVKIKCFRDTLGRFRLGVSDIQTHKNRFIRNALPGINDCPFCPGVVEDEGHLLFDCSKYDALRPQTFKGIPAYCRDQRLTEILSCTVASLNRQLAWFLFKCFDLRNNVGHD